MSECCREKYLSEYIEELDIDKNLKKRLLELCKRESETINQQDKYLQSCHMRFAELENVIIELSTELGNAKRFIRELM